MDPASIPTDIVKGAAGAVGEATVQGTIHIITNAAKNFYQRYASLQTNERKRDEICRQVTELQGILQCATETAVDTRDDHTKQALLNIHQNIKRCLEICEEIEKRSFEAKFQNTPDDVQRVQELSCLLDESIAIAIPYLSVSNYTVLPATEQSMRHVHGLVRNPQDGVYQTDSACQNEPEKVEKPTVQEGRPGVLYVCWKKISADYYELEYDRQNRNYLKVKSTECKLDSLQVCFPNNISYKIRVRGVNRCGPGEWSEATVGMFTVLPEQPQKPIAVYVNSATSITLVVKRLAGREGAKPVTHFVVEYHTEKDREMTQKVFSIDNLEMVLINGTDAFKIDLNCGAASTYLVQISHRNQDGDSLPCEDTIRVDTIPPGEPVGLKVVHTTTHTIIIEWSKPETNEYMLDHYEVQWEINGDTKMTKNKTTKKCYAVFRNLETWKEYLFKVRAVNKMGCGSRYIEIKEVTDSMTAKVAKVIGAGAATGAATTVMSPFSSVITGVAMGAGAGALAVESVEDKGKGAKVAAGTAAGIGGGVAGFALGLLATPFTIVLSPFIGTATGIGALIHSKEEELECYLEQYPDDSNNRGDYNDLDNPDDQNND